ncbi:MAG: hypothetical protein HC898_00625 [Phycisphaerales bacterium]|nr:hypothetical protein [Phycisphaerales bacterium]
MLTPDEELRQGATRKHPLRNNAIPEDLPSLACWMFERPLTRTFPYSADEAVRLQWREQTCQWLLEQLAWPYPTTPLDVKMDRIIEHDDYREEHLHFTGASPLRIPATVLVPKQGRKPYPAVLAFHDMGGMRAFGREKLLSFEGEPAYLTDFRQQYYEGVSIQRELVQRGYLVMAIDAQCFGERTPAAQVNRDGFLRDRLTWSHESAKDCTRQIQIQEPLMVRQVMSVGRTWPGLVITDDRRSLDYLCQREDVDRNRIGCIGLSFGAYRTNYLAALDDRVAAGVSVCWTSSMSGVVGYNVCGSMNWFSLIPSMFAQMDLPDLQALAAHVR